MDEIERGIIAKSNSSDSPPRTAAAADDANRKRLGVTAAYSVGCPFIAPILVDAVGKSSRNLASRAFRER
jgi:hypothetical protein